MQLVNRYLSGANQLTCLETGEWSDAFPLCRRLRCGQPLAVSDSTSRVVSYFFHGVTTYTCNEGVFIQFIY